MQGSENAFFETKIRPVLAEKCYECHSARADKIKGGLRLDHIDLILVGGDTGPALVRGNPEESLLSMQSVMSNRIFRCHPKESYKTRRSPILKLGSKTERCGPMSLFPNYHPTRRDLYLILRKERKSTGAGNRSNLRAWLSLNLPTFIQLINWLEKT